MRENCNTNGHLMTHVPILSGVASNECNSQLVPIVLDERNGTIVYIRPARLGEESKGVWISDGETPVLRMEISHVSLDNHSGPVRIVPEGREGSNVFYRHLNPGQEDTGEIVKFTPGQDTLVQVQRVSWIGLHTTPEVGRVDDLVFAMRVIPTHREGSTVYARTLQPGEPDNGEVVILKPSDQLIFPPDAISVSVEGIDNLVAVLHKDGYKSLANTLWTWLHFPGNHTSDAFRFIITAARRLDASHHLFEEVRSKLANLEEENDIFQVRNLVYEVIGAVELAIISMYRAMNMAWQLQKYFSVSTPFPTHVAAKLPQIKELRDAYEHIDERARGFKFRQHDPNAVSVFEFEQLFNKGIVSYGNNSLNINTETTNLFLDVREYLKTAVVELSKGIGQQK